MKDIIFKYGQTIVPLHTKELRYAILSIRRNSRNWTENPSTIPNTLF